MKIGVVGSGNIGGALGGHLARAGHELLFTASSLASARTAARAAGHGAIGGSIEDAIGHGEVVIVAVPFKAWPDLARSHGEHLRNRVVVDAGNPYSARDGAVADAVVRLGRGSGAYTQSLLPGAHVVKAFNTLPAGTLRDGAHAEPPLAIPLAGDDPQASALVAGLIRDAGFEPIELRGIDAAARFDPGTLVYARSLDAAAMAAVLNLE